MNSDKYDIVIVGAGIAGAGLAAQLAGSARVALLERESHPGAHSTGRSAAMFFGSYGNNQIRALSRLSRDFFVSPPVDFTEASLLRSRGSLIIAGKGQEDSLERMRADRDLSRTCINVDSLQIVEKCPLIDREKVIGGLFEHDSFDIEVHELHQGYLKAFKNSGGDLITSADITAIESGNCWSLQVGSREITAPIIVNAAGAWVDQVAQSAGVAPVGIEPRRRTAVLVPPPEGIDIGDMPMVMDIDESFYFKPDAGQILVSPADETLTEPCDAQPDELDVAIAVDHLEKLTNMHIRRVSHRWAGLRNFVPDRTPVVGFDKHHDGFFWLAGQGGYGIQTAPALSELAANLVLGKPVPSQFSDEGVDADKLSPDRLTGRLGLESVPSVK